MWFSNPEEINRLKENAENNIISMEELRKHITRSVNPVDDERFTILIQPDFRIVYTIENHPGGNIRHLSVSYLTCEDGYPPDDFIAYICKELGFINEHIFCAKLPEVFKDSPNVINIFDPVDGDWVKLLGKGVKQDVRKVPPHSDSEHKPD